MQNNRLLKNFIISGLCTLTSCASSKKDNYADILNTKDILRIETFIKSAHPDDPKRFLLKQKLISLKKTELIKGKLNHKPISVRPIEIEIPKTVAYSNNPTSSEVEEFKKLVTENSTAKKDKSIKLLNTLFDQDISNKEAMLLVQNNSDCNMIMRIHGKAFYNLAIPAHGESSIVINKGNYKLTSNVCDIKYEANKNVLKSKVIILNNPVVNIPEKTEITNTPSKENQQTKPL